MPAPFVFGGRSHLVVLALTLAVPFTFAAATRICVNVQATARLFLAAILVSGEMLWLWLVWSNGWASAATLLPLNLCDWAMIAAIVTLIRPNERSYELAYFWAFCGSLQALLTPDLAADFPDPRFIVFFLLHGGVIAAALYLTLGLRLRPSPASIPRVIIWTFLYMFAAGTADALLGTNFGFLAAKPVRFSLLSFLSPWPYYVLELVPVALFFIAFFYAPFFVLDRLRQARPRPVMPGRSAPMSRRH